jgi:DNA helicase-2/ATP-dependent DNA helicase PcrA
VAREFDATRVETGEEISLDDFLEQVSLVADADEIPDAPVDAEGAAQAEERGVVTLMTLHTAKGLEFPVVFLTGMEDGTFPHMRSLGEAKELEEERRLAYVGITRARERLHLSRATVRSAWGQPLVQPPSRDSSTRSRPSSSTWERTGPASPVARWRRARRGTAGGTPGRAVTGQPADHRPLRR